MMSNERIGYDYDVPGDDVLDMVIPQVYLSSTTDRNTSVFSVVAC